MNDQVLISRFYPAMTQGFPIPTSPHDTVEVHAELLHRICLADGLLEVLEWAKEGSAADPLACMWLAGLRWYTLLTGRHPQGAPAPPPRQSDAELAELVHNGQLCSTEGSGEASLAALASGELSYPAAPAQPDSTDRGALQRLTPLALIPYIDSPTRTMWVEQNLAMTHGHPELLQRGLQWVHDRHASWGTPPHTQDDAGNEGDDAGPPSSHPLFEVVSRLAHQWDTVTAPV